MAIHPLLTIAIRAARTAGNTITRCSDQLERLTVEQKTLNDFVSEVDRMAEKDVIEIIQKAYPNHAILSEEAGEIPAKDKEGEDFKWIIDPLDGTTNFLHGMPHYAVSIACMIKGRLEIAVVYNPVTDELFTASRGNGAKLNNTRIRVSGRPSLDGALLGTGIPFSQDRDFDAYLSTMRKFMGRPAGIRRAGAAALDLAYVAAGRFDGFWEEQLKPWDMAAGVLLVREAGGLIADLNGNSDFMESGDVVCGTPKVYNEMLPFVKR
jgi:myo-inositol-1(or 4)-monophosphatase